MSVTEDRVTNPVSPITALLLNDDREPYFVKIGMTKEEAGGFLLAMWRHVMGSMAPRDEEDALGEWTDRMRDVRSTCDWEGVCIRTHAWHPSGDRKTLHESVLEFLRSRGLQL